MRDSLGQLCGAVVEQPSTATTSIAADQKCPDNPIPRSAIISVQLYKLAA